MESLIPLPDAKQNALSDEIESLLSHSLTVARAHGFTDASLLLYDRRTQTINGTGTYTSLEDIRNYINALRTYADHLEASLPTEQ